MIDEAAIISSAIAFYENECRASGFHTIAVSRAHSAAREDDLHGLRVRLASNVDETIAIYVVHRRGQRLAFEPWRRPS